VREEQKRNRPERLKILSQDHQHRNSRQHRSSTRKIILMTFSIIISLGFTMAAVIVTIFTIIAIII